jgi:hypothetical protein
MIKTPKEIMLTKIIGLVSSAVSYVFTILMLMSFAETGLEKVLYFLCGVINDGTKWFTLLAMIKYYRAKLFKNFVGYSILFVLFAGMSMIASISFSVFTVKKQMYDVEIKQNEFFLVSQGQAAKAEEDILKLESEKTNEINRLNTELDGLPLDFVTRRKELSDKKIELTNFYDTKLAGLKTELDEKTKLLDGLDGGDIEVRKLKNNAIAGFFETIANTTKTNIDTIILIFAIALGVILDTASIALTFDSSFSYQNKREFNKDMTKYKNVKAMKMELDEKIKDFEEEKPKVLSYDDFVKYIDENDLDVSEINFNGFKSLVPRSTFYSFLNKYKKDFLDVDYNVSLSE